MQQTPSFLRYYRILRVIVHTLVGLVIAAGVLPLVSAYRRGLIIRWWCHILLKCFNIQVNTFGSPPGVTTKSTMFVANHISWSDIHALNSIIPVRFIAKLEIKSWPVFGYLVTKSGTLFINRTIRRDAARIVEMTTDSLRQFENVCFFPEGTTTDGTHMLPFKSSIVQAAIDAEASIWPVTVYYPTPSGEPNLKMAFAGETTMIESMDQILRIKYPVVELHFLAPIACQGQTRQSVTHLAREVIMTTFKQRLAHQHAKDF
ncbi:MAG: 1-acyl-sn-glycerol-3-phosphate acyltransferase [Methylophilaceae bacterium 17-44-8]|nr:MAG: 1-acyl-sn-glycerol-3-phosphate acyltransferase [Methylophilales bacterium 16-45-7]OZA06131.1 MAG: 1-acyl-sn-glycerol-3-phosphate acyltransferase [Methylophilaceae bacterium 17-44-8]